MRHKYSYASRRHYYGHFGYKPWYYRQKLQLCDTWETNALSNFGCRTGEVSVQELATGFCSGRKYNKFMSNVCMVQRWVFPESRCAADTDNACKLGSVQAGSRFHNNSDIFMCGAICERNIYNLFESFRNLVSFAQGWNDQLTAGLPTRGSCHKRPATCQCMPHLVRVPCQATRRRDPILRRPFSIWSTRTLVP